ncbi:fimbria/pilus outer membrane usher protein [Acinetobacter sp. HY1485]|uniref:fimbria/pilus outer membrane usher protein n=1 Tax=Acinetobacter sp. HY1485 TaxID=2970918 RepID=UPI0022B966FC|nr:fimbria/pilus outer membrane usher protein [Acinetobacter sp. HY1485]
MKKIIIITLAHLTFSSSVLADKLLAFDSGSLFGEQNKDIDLSVFNEENSVGAGHYLLSTTLNDQYIGQLEVKFWQPDSKKAAILCIDPSLLKRLDLKPSVVTTLKNNECTSIEQISPDASYHYDGNSLMLSLSIPLVLTNQRPEGFIAPSLFDNGITSAYLSYDFNRYSDHSNDTKNVTTNYLNLSGGINFGGFNYRHSGSFESNNEKLSRYHSSLNVLSTDIARLNSRLSLGDFSTNSYYLSSNLIRGIELSNDTSMRPWSVQSYAPVIQGVANSNALVSVFQNGQKIYERTVPIGSFTLNDVTPLATNGDLTVQITEQGGGKRSFTVPLQGNLNLVRKGQFNYNVALGRYKLDRKVSDQTVLQATAEYGLFNDFTTHLGTNLSQDYQGYLFGFGLNTLLGGVTLDAEQSLADLNHINKNGQKYRFSYHYTVLPLNLNFSLNTQHLSQNYISLANTVSLLNKDNLTESEVDNFYLTYNLKQQTSLTLRQQLGQRWGSFYATGTTSKYWNDTKTYNQYTLGYSNAWKKINYNLNVAQTQTTTSQKDKSVYLSVSIPLSWKDKTINSNTIMQHTHDNDTISTGLSGTAGEHNQLNYAFNVNKTDSQTTALTTSINYLLPQTNVGVTLATGNHQSQYGLSLQGGIVAHPYGLTLTNNLSDTFTVIHAENAAGAELTNAWGIKLDHFGNAIYPLVDPYHINTLSINSKNLPLNVALKNNQAQVIPRRYSATLLNFETTQTSNVLLDLQTKYQIPMGIEVKDAQGNTSALMGQANQLFINNNEVLKQPIVLHWGVNNTSTCTIPTTEQKLNKKTNLDQFQSIRVVCE